jgi:hypothetical protein
MANPNIAAASQIRGRTEMQKIGTSLTAIASNATSSNTVFKINVLVVTNVTSSDVSVTADILRSGVATHLVKQILIPPNSAVVLAAKENPFYLLEGDALRLSASDANAAEAICSFEEFVA